MKKIDAVILALCACAFVVMVWPLRGTLVDDTYIHLQYARNLAEAGELSFNRGDPTYGATSPLFVFILSLIHRLGGDLLAWCRVLSWLFALGSIALVYRFALMLGGSRLAAGLAALMMAAEAWLLRWSAVGMETSFFVFMVTAVLIAAFSSSRSAGRSIMFGILLFLAVLTRPEALLLAALAVIAFSLARHAKVCPRFVWLPLFLVLLALWLYVVGLHTGSFLPLTAGAKQGRPVLSLQFFRRAVVPIQIMGATIGLPWLSLIAGLIVSAVKERRIFALFEPSDAGTGDGAPERARISSTAGLTLAMLWIFALPLAYVVFDFQVLSRYVLPVSPAVIVLGTTALLRIGSRLHKSPVSKKALIAAFAMVVVVQNLLFYSFVVVPPTRAFSEGLHEVLGGMGEWLKDNSDAEAVVATPDIGAIGYISGRRVLDLGGLVTPEINRMRRRIEYEEIVEEGFYLNFKADFLVDRSAIPNRFDGAVIRDAEFIPVMRGVVPNLGIRQPDPVHYVLYRIIREEVRGGGED